MWEPIADYCQSKMTCQNCQGRSHWDFLSEFYKKVSNYQLIAAQAQLQAEHVSKALQSLGYENQQGRLANGNLKDRLNDQALHIAQMRKQNTELETLLQQALHANKGAQESPEKGKVAQELAEAHVDRPLQLVNLRYDLLNLFTSTRSAIPAGPRPSPAKPTDEDQADLHEHGWTLALPEAGPAEKASQMETEAMETEAGTKFDSEAKPEGRRTKRGRRMK